MFRGGWRLGSIGGIAIRIDASWAFVALLVTYSLWLRFADVYETTLSSAGAFLLALAAAALFFGSVLGHELAHAGMARLRGIPVAGITLFLFGGATSARVEDKGPGDEFLVTVVGPGSSLALAALFWGLSNAAGDPGDPIPGALGYLAVVNLMLGVFNLVPGFPLDGGRLLRSGIWRFTGDLDRATRVAAWGGQAVGVLLMAAGVWLAFQADPAAAIWLAFIGWFLFQGARGSLQQQRVRSTLSRGVVAEAMRPPPPAVPAAMSLLESLDRYLAGNEGRSFPVVEGDRLVGVLTFDGARRIGRDDPSRPVRDAMIPLRDVTTVSPGDRLDGLADTFGDGTAALVVEDGRLVGTISTEDLSRWLRARRTG